MTAVSAIFKRERVTPFTVWVAFLSIIIAAGVVAGVIVFAYGLQVTNLTDLVPWGLWITIDLSSIAMSAGAFLLCAAVYLLGLKQYQPVARTATFVGLIGYSMAVLTLLLDIGRPDRFYNALLYWNPHSLLWEVTMCVTLYLTVLLFETAPIFAELPWFKNRFPKIAAKMSHLHHFAPYLAVVGLLLSSLHQSSLGATYGVVKARPIWFRPDLSVLFMASAIAGGPALTIFISMLAAKISHKVYVDDRLLEKLAHFVGWTLVVYGYFRLWDALAMTYTTLPGRTEGLAMLTKGALSFNFWIGEALLGILVPMVLLLKKKTRHNVNVRMLALLLVVSGVVAYRWDINMAGQLALLTYLPHQITTLYTNYVPSLIEILAGAGVVAYGALAVTLGIRYLKIVDHRPEVHAEAHAAVPSHAAAD